jgi:hypothetical protein
MSAERERMQAQHAMFATRTACNGSKWLWIRDGGSADTAVALWHSVVLSCNHRAAIDEPFWTYSSKQLGALQQKHQGTDSEMISMSYPWLLPVQKKTSRWHTNQLIPEDLSYCLHAPDVITYESPITLHVPVLWFHVEQLERCALAGITPPIASGPPTFTTSYEHGVLYYQGFGPAMPETMEDLFIDFMTWAHVNDWVQSYLAEIERVQQGGYHYNASHIVGGRDGIDISLYAMKEVYRKCVWHNGGVIDGVYRPGVPVPQAASLPDAYTQVRVFDIYRSAEYYQCTDKAICSMMALYGIESGTACSGTSSLIPNYKGAWSHLELLQQVRDAKQRDYGLFPRLTVTTQEVQYWPTRFLPKGVAQQEKDDGSVKDRATTDAGARRQSIRAARRQQHHDRTSEVLQSFAGEYNRLRSNASPGLDSPNACIPESTLLDIRWGSVTEFTKSIDILLSSKLPVDIVIRDFKSWYEEWSRAPSEVHLCGQIVGGGVEYDTSCCFGWRDCAHLLSRCNYTVLDMIQQELDVAQATFDFEGVDPVAKRKMIDWTEYRRAQGYHGRWTSVLPFIDDNTFACISANGRWTAKVIEVVEQMWQRFNYEISHDKSETNVYDAKEWSPVLGRIMHTRNRETSLPPKKVKRYCDDIDKIVAAATAHPRRLVEKKTCEQAFGRLLFACDAGVPSVWPDFLSLISAVSGSWSQYWVQLTSEAQHLLLQAKWKLQNLNAACFTPYTPRPMSDGWPIVVCYTDASRKPLTMEGDYGGWIWLHGSRVVYFFSGWFSPEGVAAADINELETIAAEISASLAHHAVPRMYGGSVSERDSDEEADDADSDRHGAQMHYLYSFGDSQVFFEHVMPGASANSHGLRFLYRRRAQADQQRPRITITTHVLRGKNVPADHLSNGLIEPFKVEIESVLGPGLTFVRLDVSAEMASLKSLIDWKRSCA